MRFDSSRPPRRADAAPDFRPPDSPPRGFWGAVAFGTTQWAIRRSLFLLACGALGALVSVVLDGGGALQGAIIGMVAGFAALIAWFMLSNW